MSPTTTNQDQYYIKWFPHTFQTNKDLATYNNNNNNSTIYNTSQKNKWTPSAYNLSPATAVSSRSTDSPIISTPFLDPSVDEMLSPVLYSPHQTSPLIYHHSPPSNDISVGQYIDQGSSSPSCHGKKEPIFTGDPMELLIDKSKANNNSPFMDHHHSNYPSSSTSTPFQDTNSLFAPIEPSSSSCYQSQQQQQYNVEYHHYYHHHHHHDNNMFDHCNNSILFQALEGITNSSPSLISPSSHVVNYENSQQQQQKDTSPNSSSSEFYSNQSAAVNDNHQSHDTKNDNNNSNNSNDTKSVTQSQSITTPSKRKRGGNKPTDNNNNESSDSDDESIHYHDDHSSSSSQRRTRRRRTTKNNNDNKPEEKRFGCPICKRKFSRRYNLNTHIRTHNANRIKEFVCDICGAAFDRKHDRGRHLDSVHYGNRSYECHLCKATFCRRDALVRHSLKTHPE